jgi:hypothetical protein
MKETTKESAIRQLGELETFRLQQQVNHQAKAEDIKNQTGITMPAPDFTAVEKERDRLLKIIEAPEPGNSIQERIASLSAEIEELNKEMQSQ